MRRAGAVTLPAREGDPRVFGQLPPDEINFDDWTALRASARALRRARRRALPAIAFTSCPACASNPTSPAPAGARPRTASTPPIGVDEETRGGPAAPRAFAPQSARRLTLTASWGIYYQPPAAEDLSAVFGNPALPLARADPLRRGRDRGDRPSTLGAELTVFRTTSSSLAARSPLDTPLVGQALVPYGEGRVVGGQLTLRQQLAARFFGWISYSLIRSERLDPIVVDDGTSGASGPTFVPGPARLFDFDQTHILTAVGSYDLGHGFEIGARVRYATGFPRTPVIDSVPDLRRGPDQPVFGPVNSIRLPAFFQADVRIAKRLRIDRGTLEIYLDVQNVGNRANAEEFAYSADYRTRYEITGLPILPVLGARYAW